MKLIERKSTLAKLLAKENITVTHGNMKTAYFDVKNRVLGLPVWKDRGRAVYDMLIGHEVGHALYTPSDAIERYNAACPGAPFDVCNIVEDIRIERLIKAAYPGLPRLFNSAYDSLVEADFFGVADKDLASLKFLDRLNLRGKVGDFLDVPLNSAEEEIYEKCLAAETYEDVLEICKEIVSAKDSEEPNSSESGDDESDESEGEEMQTPSGDEGDESAESEEPEASDSEAESDSDETEDDGEEASGGASDEEGDESEESEASSENIKSDSDSDSDESETAETTTAGDNPNTSDNDDDLTSDTLTQFDKSLLDEVETPKSQGFMPVMLPRKSYVKENIIGYKKLASLRNTVDVSMTKYVENFKTSRPDLNNIDYDIRFASELVSLRKKTTKKVGTLVREFERRKAAYQYSRSQESATGVIDPCKLHAYKTTDQIFLSKSILADAKSHGMIFLIDYSGSMNRVLPDVIEQTLNLVEFCKKVGIPFDVYSFTCSYYGRYETERTITPTFNEVKLEDTLLIHQLSSDMSKSEYTEATKNLWAQYWLQKNGLNRMAVAAKPYERLGGTPLDNVLTMMHSVVTEFVEKHRVQKTMFVTLTDGESSYLDVNFTVGETAPKSRIKANGKTYEFGRWSATKNLTKMIGDIPTVSTLGFFIPTGDPKYKLRDLVGWEKSRDRKYTKSIKANGFAEFSDVIGYDTFFLLNPDLETKDDEFVYSSTDSIADSRKAQNKLAKEFSKHHGCAKNARVLMSRIAEKVA